MALVGIRSISDRYQSILEEFILQTREIIGEEDEFGHSGDFVYGSRDLDDMLKILKIKVNEK